jgi:hydrogenase nickel incorporation protein HypB
MLRLYARSGSGDKPPKLPPIFHAADLAVITKGDIAEALGFDSASAPRNIQVVSPDLHIITV